MITKALQYYCALNEKERDSFPFVATEVPKEIDFGQGGVVPLVVGKPLDETEVALW